MLYNAQEIADICSGQISGNQISDLKFSSALTDSRNLISSENTLFFAIKTQRNDGHNYISELYNQGVRGFVVERGFVFDQALFTDAVFIIVENTLNALQQIAVFHRKKFSIPIIAITGSNGKTIVKEWLYWLLSKHQNTIRSPRSFNSQIGVPLSVLLTENFHKYAIFEAGISQNNEMQNLEEIIKPDFGIFTNIGPAHDENFKNIEQKIEEKTKLFENCKKLVVCSAHAQIINKLNNKHIKTFLWGNNENDDIVIIEKTISSTKTKFIVKYQSEIFNFSIPFTDEASSENAMNSFACMLMLGFDANEVCQSMSFLPTIAMRLELRQAINSCFLINDAYNSDLQSLSLALDFLKQQQKHRKTCVIISDMKQTGLKKENLYSSIAQKLAKREINRLIGIGPDISSQKEIFANIPNTQFFESTNDYIKQHSPDNFNEEAILIKGSRSFEFEKLVRLFEQKTHNTVLEINLNSILHNLNSFRSILKPETKVMAMVKSFSYGCGSFEIASLLQHHHIDYLGVAYADEGIELRRNGIEIPIMVMVPEEISSESIINYQLEPEIYNFHSLSWFSKFKNRKINIHLKLDTGMHRLGFQEEDIDELVKILKDLPNINVKTIFSHLAAADDPNSDDFTNMQISNFSRMTEKLMLELKINPRRHILNSAGIERFPQAQFEMVRLGLGLYGVKNTLNSKLQLQNVSCLKSTIIQTKEIKAGERISYGSECVANKDMKLAVVPIGYADGFRRILSNGRGKIRVNGVYCKVVGKVCMDMTIIDIGNLNVKVGDEAIIFDEKYKISDFAKEMEVIPYEIFTSISQRVKRTYLFE